MIYLLLHLHHGRAPVRGISIGVTYWLLFAAFRPALEVLLAWWPPVALFLDRLTAILELVLPFTLPVLALGLAGLCFGMHLRCRELEGELETA